MLPFPKDETIEANWEEIQQRAEERARGFQIDNAY
jgi:hypothetical protein